MYRQIENFIYASMTETYAAFKNGVLKDFIRMALSVFHISFLPPKCGPGHRIECISDSLYLKLIREKR